LRSAVQNIRDFTKDGLEAVDAIESLLRSQDDSSDQ